MIVCNFQCMDAKTETENGVEFASYAMSQAKSGDGSVFTGMILLNNGLSMNILVASVEDTYQWIITNNNDEVLDRGLCNFIFSKNDKITVVLHGSNLEDISAQTFALSFSFKKPPQIKDFSISKSSRNPFTSLSVGTESSYFSAHNIRTEDIKEFSLMWRKSVASMRRKAAKNIMENDKLDSVIYMIPKIALVLDESNKAINNSAKPFIISCDDLANTMVHNPKGTAVALGIMTSIGLVVTYIHCDLTVATLSSAGVVAATAIIVIPGTGLSLTLAGVGFVALGTGLTTTAGMGITTTLWELKQESDKKKLAKAKKYIESHNYTKGD